MVRDGEEERSDVERTAEQWFAQNVKNARASQGITQGALAAKMAEKGFAWHQATVYKIENGTRQVQLGEAQAVAEILALPLEQLTAKGTEIDRLFGEIETEYQFLQEDRDRLTHRVSKTQEELFKLQPLRDYTSGKNVILHAVWDSLLALAQRLRDGSPRRIDFSKILLDMGFDEKSLKDAEAFSSSGDDETDYHLDPVKIVEYLQKHYKLDTLRSRNHPQDQP
ncbi:helix-turn-helix domain-containing protein [Rhodococcus sp. ARC_M12]|uniref:helix-turn-helix transcriptional regulator n=1 Tax=Rhodococcus sp. ARC_M12 TaxID=2928854 RepID=UPI001FB2259E|nr:helix-turn-helix transcriptional regulator [Rhodococcus sp. ARC_M12]MCJ0980409.1 helix-turn-helix domain-containing protein [Rhodococcus sp. ARC_M12]